MGVKCFSFCSPGLLSLVAYVGPDGWGNLIHACISMAISFIVTFLLVWFWGFEETEQPEETKTEKIEPAKADSTMDSKDKKDTQIVVSPARGEAVALSEVPDATFAEEILGKGVAIKLEGNEIYSPVDGKVESIFPTNHAIGLVADSGAEIMIHIGLDTVQLDGKFFEAQVEPGQYVKKGDLLIRCELKNIQEAGYQTITPVIVTNTDAYTEVEALNLGKIEPGMELIRVR